MRNRPLPVKARAPVTYILYPSGSRVATFCHPEPVEGRRERTAERSAIEAACYNQPMDFAYCYSPIFMDHKTGEHPENPQRLVVINNEVEKFIPRETWPEVWIDPPDATHDQIAEIHTRGHIELVQSTCAKGHSALEMDTPISPLSYAAALKAAGAGIHAVESVMSGKIKCAFCAVRPPGHHAEKDRAMGFCLFNNIAIAAKYALKNGAKKVAIVDWDVHHGNGTQHSFESDTDVFFASFHHWGIYPGTGHQSETGKGDAEGLTVNYPLPGDTGDDKYLSIMEEDLIPKLREYKPDLILISAGFDAHEADPLGGMNVTDDGFKKMTKLLMELADETCNGKIVSFLEGGYNLSTLGKTVALHVKTLMED